MPIHHSRAAEHIIDLLSKKSEEALLDQLSRKHHQMPPRVPGGTRLTQEALDQRWRLLTIDEDAKNQILDPQAAAEREVYQKNIENFIGTIKMPIGLIGPLRVNGLYA